MAGAAGAARGLHHTSLVEALCTGTALALLTHEGARRPQQQHREIRDDGCELRIRIRMANYFKLGSSLERALFGHLRFRFLKKR